jgi:hypothetical protein
MEINCDSQRVAASLPASQRDFLGVLYGSLRLIFAKILWQDSWTK